MLVANDENPSAAYWSGMLPLVGGSINAATWHMYCGYGLDPNLPNDAWNHVFMECIDKTAAPLLSAGRNWSASTNGSFWVGETAMAWHSGRDNVTNSFLSTPWWLTQLGALSATHAVQCRQTLVGGYYELIDRGVMQPNLDYWAALLWKRVMGRRRLTASNTAWGPVLSYVHCAVGGGVAVEYVNFNPTQAYVTQVSIDGVLPPPPRLEYMLTPVDGNYSARNILLNGSPLTFEGGVLSPTPPRVGSGDLVLAPKSLGFVVYPNAQLEACL